MYTRSGARWIRAHPPQVPSNTATATNSGVCDPRGVESDVEAAVHTIPFATAVPITMMTTTPLSTQVQYNGNNRNGVDDGSGSGTDDALPVRSIKCGKLVKIGLMLLGLVAVSVIITAVVMKYGFNVDDTVPADVTKSPVSFHTNPPVSSPTNPPVSSPTNPRASSTNSPVYSPTNPPVPFPTDSPVSTPTNPPVFSPTNPPVFSPTNPPVSSPAITITTTAITIQAEGYSNMLGVKTEGTTDEGGGMNVGSIDTGDWMSYPEVNIPSAGTYTVEYRVSSESGGGTLQFEKAGGEQQYGSIEVPVTGDWQTWETISHNVNLEAGPQYFGIVATAGGWNLNWFRINMHITIQAEDYLEMLGVKTEGTTDEGGGMNVGSIDTGDWMYYPEVYIPSAGTYSVEYRVSSESVGGTLRFEKAGGEPEYGTIDVPDTGDWQTWETISHNVNLEAGPQYFGIVATAGGWNLNWFRITKSNE
jgi:hypothetical protein